MRKTKVIQFPLEYDYGLMVEKEGDVLTIEKVPLRGGKNVKLELDIFSANELARAIESIIRERS